MTPTSFWALIGVTVVVLIGLGTFIAVAKGRAKGRSDLIAHEIATRCTRLGHAYREEVTAWRCVECGNYVPRIEGEVYGPADEGRRERRLEDR
jgi:hypothetical protein